MPLAISLRELAAGQLVSLREAGLYLAISLRELAAGQLVSLREAALYLAISLREWWASGGRLSRHFTRELAAGHRFAARSRVVYGAPRGIRTGARSSPTPR